MGNYQRPANLISVAKGMELNENYNSKRAPVIENSIGKEDANAVWFSVEELQNYIDYIKTEGAAKGHDVDGIRFYLGVYSDNEAADKAGYTTLFLSPTCKVPNSTEVAQDMTDMELLNYGSIGHPPKIEYGR